MISARKFRRLPYSTRVRKTYRLVLDLQRGLRRTERPAVGMVELLHAAAELSQEDVKALEASNRLRALATALERPLTPAPDLEWLCDRAIAALEALCGVAPADWDLLPPTSAAAPSAQPRKTVAKPAPLAEITLYLENLRSPFNIGSISRSAAAFGCSRLCLSPGCANEQHPRSQRAAMGALGMLVITRISLFELRRQQPNAVVVALETGGIPLEEFRFPRQGILVLGNEELGIDPSTLAAPDVRRVSIPSYGDKATLNVGVAAGIALSWWRAS